MTHKYGVNVPCSVEEAYDLDTKNGNTLWQDSLDKEMSNFQVELDILYTDCNISPGWSKVSGHKIFDVSMTLEQKYL